MELHAIWNRIDQLEKLLISQAKEIDVLRRMVNSTQISVQNITTSLQKNNNFNNDNSPNNNSSTMRLIHKSYMGNQVNNNRNSIHLSSISTKDNQQVNIFNRPNTYHQPTYLMNSFVHPAIAIPPTNLAPSYNMDNNKLKLETTNACGGDFSNLASTVMPHQTSNMNRWSVGPTLRLHDSIVDRAVTTKTTILDNHQDLTEMRDGRHKRQCFVEILTCFCPCFSMC